MKIALKINFTPSAEITNQDCRVAFFKRTRSIPCGEAIGASEGNALAAIAARGDSSDDVWLGYDLRLIRGPRAKKSGLSRRQMFVDQCAQLQSQRILHAVVNTLPLFSA